MKRSIIASLLLSLTFTSVGLRAQSLVMTEVRTSLSGEERVYALPPFLPERMEADQNTAINFHFFINWNGGLDELNPFSIDLEENGIRKKTVSAVSETTDEEGNVTQAATSSLSYTPRIAGIQSFDIVLRDVNRQEVFRISSEEKLDVHVYGVNLINPAEALTLPVGSGTFLQAAALFRERIVARMEFLADGVVIGSDATEPYALLYTENNPGESLITARAVLVGEDDPQEGSLSASIQFVERLQEPSVDLRISSPGSGETLAAGTPIQVTVDARDSSGVPLRNVQFFADGALVGTDTTFPYTFTWTQPRAGAFDLRAIATDSFFNRIISEPMSVVVTDGQPFVAITSPIGPQGAPFEVVAGTRINLHAIASGSGGVSFGGSPELSRVTEVRYFADGNQIGSASAPPYTVPWRVDDAAAEPRTFRVVARVSDANGATAESAPVFLRVIPNQSPSLRLIAPVSEISTGSSLLLGADWDDNDGLVETFYFYANGQRLPQPAGSPEGSAPVIWQPTQAGTYTLSVTGIDNIGRSAQSAPVTVNVVEAVGEIPVVSLFTSPTNASAPRRYSQGSTILLRANAFDPEGERDDPEDPARGISRILFYRNGALIGERTAAPFLLRTALTSPTGSLQGDLFTAIAFDAAGNVNTSSLEIITQSLTQNPPAIDLSRLRGNRFAPGASVLLEADVAFPEEPIDGVLFFVDGVPVGQGQPDAVGAQGGRYTFSAGSLAPGSYEILALAHSAVEVTISFPNIDENGSISFEEITRSVTTSTVANPVTITVGNDGPVAEEVLLSHSSETFPLLRQGEAVTLEALPLGLTESIREVRFLLGQTVLGTDLNAPWTLTWHPIDPGTQTLAAEVVTSSGRVITSEPYSLNVNASIFLIEPAPARVFTTEDTIPLSAHLTLDHSEPVSYFLNDSLTGIAVPGTALERQLAAGDYRAYAEISLPNGRTIRSQSVEFRVNTPTLEIGITAPQAGSLLTAYTEAAISVAVNSPASGATVQIFANGTLIGILRDTRQSGSNSDNGNGDTGEEDETSGSSDDPLTLRWTPSVAGAVTLTAEAALPSGVSASAAPVTVTVQALPLAVSLTAPTASSTLRAGNEVTLRARVVNANPNTFVEFYANDNLLGFDPGATDKSEFSFTWRPAAAGPHTLRAEVVRSSPDGLRAVSSSRSVEVLPPVEIEQISPTLSTYYSGLLMTLDARVFGEANGDVRFFANGQRLQPDPLDDAQSSSATSLTFRPDFTGAIDLTAEVSLNGGGTFLSAPYRLDILPSPMSLEITSPAPGQLLTEGTAYPLAARVSNASGPLRVQFFVFAGDSRIGIEEARAADFAYRATWIPRATGNARLVAVVTSDLLGQVEAAPVDVEVTRTQPTVVLTTPASGQDFRFGEPVTITAIASAVSGSGGDLSVFFYANDDLIAEVSRSVGQPQTFSTDWQPPATGSHVLSARIFEAGVGSSTSAPVTITVNAGQTGNTMPTAILTAPEDGLTLTTEQTVTLLAEASDPDGIVERVRFFASGSLLGETATRPFSLDWTPLAPGDYNLTAVAFDNQGGVSEASPARRVSVVRPEPVRPSVIISQPLPGTEIILGSTIRLLARATSPTGNVNQVNFFANDTLIDTRGFNDSLAERELEFSYVPELPGTHLLKVVATGGGQTGQASIPVIVRALNPLLSAEDFVAQTHADLLLEAPSADQRARDAARLNQGELTQAAYLAELLASGGFNDTRHAAAANLVVLGEFPPFPDLRAQVNFLRDPTLEAGIRELAGILLRSITFRQNFGDPTSLDNSQFVLLTFGNTYGQAPNAQQHVQGFHRLQDAALFSNPLPEDLPSALESEEDLAAILALIGIEGVDSNYRLTREAFLEALITGSPVATAPNGYPMDLFYNPPNNRLPAWSERAALLTGLWRQPALNEEIANSFANNESLQQFAERLLNDPRYTDRFESIPAFAARPLALSSPTTASIAFSPWFGWIDTAHSPWLYHYHLGWLHASQPAHDQAWLWDPALGWTFAAKHSFPFLFQHNSNSWLYYQPGSNNPRWFYATRTQEWFTR